MRKYEMYPGYHDLFKYFGTTEIERVRIKGAKAIRRDWIVFKTVDEALECSIMETRPIREFCRENSRNLENDYYRLTYEE